jgi:D-alanyl-D-alanine carboxypeptidase/D-alanyl-D-alanine-endopeptidase (penicillin-binding protein 4)
VAALAVLATGTLAAEKKSAADKSPKPAAEATPSGGQLSARDLAAKLSHFAGDARLAGAHFGMCVVEVDSGQKIFGHEETSPMVPASNMKLATTAAALVTLGQDWRFHTTVGTLGKDLVVIGGGDPNLSGRFFDGDTVGAFRRWAKVLKERGLKQIDGDLVYDDSLFDAQWVNPSWPPNQYEGWYEAPVSALVVNDSCLDISVKGAAKAGEAAAVKLDPPTAYFPTTGQVMTRSGKGDWSVSRNRESPTLILKGNIGSNVDSGVEHLTPVDPGLFAATVIKETLEAEGLAIKGQVVRRRVWTKDWQMPKEFKAVLVHSSTLAQSVRVANKRSQNLYAECILKTLAAFGESTDKGKLVPAAQGSWAGGRAEVAKALKSLGVATDDCVFDDGCGLSHKNRLTAGTITQLLVTMAKRPESQLWIDSLAVAGETEGTLRKRMKESELEGRVFVKTGFVNGSKALSGYIKSQSGRLLAFSLLTNNYHSGHEINTWQDDICEAMVKY